MPKINQEEYEVLRALDSRAKSIVRQARGWLWVAEQPIMKDEIGWYVEDGFDAVLEDDSLFHFIQWEDREPYNVAELVKEYESILIKSTPWTPNPLDFESEDIGMKKDIEWFKKEFDEVIEFRKQSNPSSIWDMVINATLKYIKENFKNLINQLDESEALSQELPVIPKFVADYIEECKRFDESGRKSLYTAMDSMPKEASEWMTFDVEGFGKGQELFARAWLDGYTVEKEQKYYVLDSDDIPLLERVDNQAQKTITRLSIYEKGRDRYRFELTEQEIKDYDERYIPFMVPVDEVNNE